MTSQVSKIDARQTGFRTNCLISRQVGWQLKVFLLIAGMNLVTASFAFAKPELKALFPRSIKIGSQVDLTAKGTFKEWPVKIWINRPGLKITPGKKGVLSVDASENPLPGVYLIRLVDATGASEAIPLVVDSAEVLIESEPNQSPQQANLLKYESNNVSGTLAKSGDVDCYRITCAKGQELYAGILANPAFGQSIDAIVQVCDSRGFVLDQNDDRRGMDPSLVVKIPADGDYVVRTFAFPATPNSTVRYAGGADYRYLLTVSTTPVLTMVYPLTDKSDGQPSHLVFGDRSLKDVEASRHDFGDHVLFDAQGYSGFFELSKSQQGSKSITEAEKIPESGLAVPFDFTGSISQPRQLDWIPVQGKKGKRLRIRVESRRFGLELDPVVTLYDPTGKQLVSRDDNSKSDPDLRIDYTPKNDGLFYIRVKDAADGGGTSFYYRLQVESVRPNFVLAVKQSSFELEVGKPLEIEVSIERQDGFNLPIELFIDGLPDGVEVVTAKSEAKGASAKLVKLKVSSTKEFQEVCRVRTKLWNTVVDAEYRLPSGHKIKDLWITGRSDASDKEGKK